MNHPLVSVIIPAFNVEAYLRRCIQSLENQNYENIEIFIIDDGSKDGTLNVANELKKSFANIKIFSNAENRGQATARNVGLENAKGKYIMFLDADDTYDNNSILSIVNFAEDQNCDVLFAPYKQIINGKTDIVGCSLDTKAYSNCEFASKCLSIIPWSVMSCIGAKLYRTDFLKAENIKFSEYYKFNEDGAFMMCALKEAHTVGYFNKPFYNYYIRTEGSTQSSYRTDMFIYIARTDLLLLQYLKSYKCFGGLAKKNYCEKEIALAVASIVNEIKYRHREKVPIVMNDIRSSTIFNTVRINSEKVRIKYKILLAMLEYLPAQVWKLIPCNLFHRNKF